MTRLHCGGYQFGDAGAEIVADFLKHDETLIEVRFLGCSIGPRGAKAIAKALKHNKTVEFMNLANNHIGEEGAEALIDALHFNVFIPCIRIWSNNVDRQVVSKIEYLAEWRNALHIPAIVCRASLCLIAARRNYAGAGTFAILPKEIVKMIAMEVWATRKEPIWIQAVSGPEYIARQTSFVEVRMSNFNSNSDSDSDSDQ